VTEDVARLVAYRLDQARQTLEAGRELLSKGHFRDAINRAYYAMFYAALGLLAARQLGSSKHAGVLSLFSRHFVNSGEFPAATAVYLRQAFDLRQKFDYREFAEPDRDQAEGVVQHAADFLADAERTWERIDRAGP
jgi:uncharacterized protein (UPF0332 family)